MSFILNKLQIYGWDNHSEIMLMSSLLSGSRVLMVSPPGAGKTLVASKMAKALAVRYGSFDLNAVGFEDILGLLDVAKLKEGIYDYVKTPGVIWNKEFVCYEEINRCKPSIVGKILEHLKSGTISGVPTGTNWCWANMNPMTSEGTNKLPDAIIDRFSFFIWPPKILDMSLEDTAIIAKTINADDTPAFKYFSANKNSLKTPEDTTDYAEAGRLVRMVVEKAAEFYADVEKSMPNLPYFLAAFSTNLYTNMKQDIKENNSAKPIELSGRRLGYIYRNILSYRAIELAYNALFSYKPSSIETTIQQVIINTIPYGINDSSIPHPQMKDYITMSISQCIQALNATTSEELKLFYDLMYNSSVLDRISILTSGKITDPEQLISGWSRLASMNERSANSLAFIALQLNTKLAANGKKTFIPESVINHFKKLVNVDNLERDLPKLSSNLAKSLNKINDLLDSYFAEDKLAGILAVDIIHTCVSMNPTISADTLIMEIKNRVTEYNDLVSKVER